MYSNPHRDHTPSNSGAGLTLIEMSIALVIIGLIVGGIFVGRDMIRLAHIQKLSSASQEIFTKIQAFRIKYNALPGEFFTYQQFFPTLVGPYCPKTSYMSITNNNGLIDTGYEENAAFAQLHAAGLIAMGKPQILSDGTVLDHYDCYYNGQLSSAAFSTAWGNIYGSFSPINGKNGIVYGQNFEPVLTVAEMRAFDLKFDDGMPYTGRIVGRRTNTTPSSYCTSDSNINNTTATYYMFDANKMACNLIIGE